MQTLQTRLVVYRCDIDTAEGAEAYAAIKADRKAAGVRKLHMWGGKASGLRLESGPITLETTFLFADQWNSTTHRVFDWFEDADPGIRKNIKRGHYLIISDEMRAIRKSVGKCGWCGKHYPDFSEGDFCLACIDGPHLQEKDLHLLRVLPVGDERTKRAPLTEEEAAWVSPMFTKYQIEGNKAREAAKEKKIRAELKQRLQDAREKSRVALVQAEEEYNGKLWLHEHGINTENVIFYSHTGRFGFGWRKPLAPAEHALLLEKLGAEFPHDYDIKTTEEASPC